MEEEEEISSSAKAKGYVFTKYYNQPKIKEQFIKNLYILYYKQRGVH